MYKNIPFTKAILNSKLVLEKEYIIMSVQEINNIDDRIRKLSKRIENLEDELFNIRNINIQFAILLGLENEEIENLIKVNKNQIECFR